MTEITVTSGTLKKHSMGNLLFITADVTSVGNGETWTVPHIRKIYSWGFSCTTDDTSGGTVAKNVITIANGASIAGTIWAMGK